MALSWMLEQAAVVGPAPGPPPPPALPSTIHRADHTFRASPDPARPEQGHKGDAAPGPSQDGRQVGSRTPRPGPDPPSGHREAGLRCHSANQLEGGMAALGVPRRKSTFVGLDSHTPIMSRKRSMRSCMSELEALAAQRRRQVPTIPIRQHRSARIDLMAANIQNEFGVCGWILTVLSYVLIFFTLPISLCMCIKVVQEYERAVIFRLGRLMPGGAKGPGIFFIVPCIDTYRKVDLRVLSFEVPPQEILSKDSVTVAVDAVVYFRISNATISVTNVEDASRSTKLLAQTTLRNILGTKTLAEMLSDREAISLQIQATLDDATEPWGVKVERVEVKDIRLPVQLQRAMAAEAEAAREARAKVIVAEGEQKASKALKEAAEVIAESPSALQLRYLQTLNSISAEKNSTIIFPLPIDLLNSFLHRPAPKTSEAPSGARKIRSCCVHKYPDWVQNVTGNAAHSSQQAPQPQQHKSMRDSYQQPSTQMPLDEKQTLPLPSISPIGRGTKRSDQANLLKAALANRLQPRLQPPPHQSPQRRILKNGASKPPMGKPHQEEMNTSILRNPAWYRDSDGRTGFRPMNLQDNQRLQNSEIKPVKRSGSVDSRASPQRLLPPQSRVTRTASDQSITLPKLLERRGSVQSDSSRGSQIPKSVTFCDKVVVKEIEEKEEEDRTQDDYGECSPGSGDDYEGDYLPSDFLRPELQNRNGTVTDEEDIAQLNEFLKPSVELDLRSSPSLNLDLVMKSVREKPEALSPEEWNMLQSLYVPDKSADQQWPGGGRESAADSPSPLPPPCDMALTALSPKHSNVPSPIKGSPRPSSSMSSQPGVDPHQPDNRTLPEPRRPIPVKPASPTQPNFTLSDVLRSVAPPGPPVQAVRPVQSSLGQESSSDENTFKEYSSEPELIKANNNCQLSNTWRCRQSPLDKKGHLESQPTSSNYSTIDKKSERAAQHSSSPCSDAKSQDPLQESRRASSSRQNSPSKSRPPGLPAAPFHPISTPASPTHQPSKLKRPTDFAPKPDLAISFYDNVDAKLSQFQGDFVHRFGTRKAPIASPEGPPRLGRKESCESNLSADSRESVVSAASFRAEARIRRHFNY